MNAFTFRVPSISREGFFHFFRVKSLPPMQHLFEEQTTLFHLAEHLSPLSLTVNVRNMGKKPPRGTPGFLTLQSIGEAGEQARSHPMFKAAGSTPVCIITAAALRESLQQNLEVVTRKEKKAWNYRKTLRKLPVEGEESFQSQYCDVHIKRHMMCLQMHRCDNSQHLHPLSQNQHLSQRERVLNKLQARQHRRGSPRPSAAAARWKDAGFLRFHTSGEESQTVLSSIASFNLWINKPTNPINW